MGVSIHFPNFTLDCGYFGFKILQENRQIAPTASMTYDGKTRSSHPLGCV